MLDPLQLWPYCTKNDSKRKARTATLVGCPIIPDSRGRHMLCARLQNPLGSSPFQRASVQSCGNINHEICSRNVLAWQTGYGVVSFGTKYLPWVVAYIQNQESHHAADTVHDRLERITQIEDEDMQWEAR